MYICEGMLCIKSSGSQGSKIVGDFRIFFKKEHATSFIGRKKSFTKLFKESPAVETRRRKRVAG